MNQRRQEIPSRIPIIMSMSANIMLVSVTFASAASESSRNLYRFAHGRETPLVWRYAASFYPFNGTIFGFSTNWSLRIGPIRLFMTSQSIFSLIFFHGLPSALAPSQSVLQMGYFAFRPYP